MQVDLGEAPGYGGPGADLLQAAGTTVVRGGSGSDRVEAVAGSPDLVGAPATTSSRCVMAPSPTCVGCSATAP